MKAWQSRRVRNPGATEEDDLPVLVELQESFGDVRAVFNELHG